jgi:ABC-type phosphate transport system ATPase subunit
MEPILEAKSLNLWYGPNHALHDVSVAIPERQITIVEDSGKPQSIAVQKLLTYFK